MSQFAPARPRPLDTPVSIAVVASMYNNQFVQGLVNAVAAELEDLAPQATVDVYRVPGAFEIPVTTELVLRNSKPDAIIALGRDHPRQHAACGSRWQQRHAGRAGHGGASLHAHRA
jgi:6,7-dimethyl-8-ribityllumazine synthase